MEWVHRQLTQDYQSDSRNQSVRSGPSYGLDKQVPSEMLVEDWCDSGLDSLSGVALGIDVPYSAQNTTEQTWTCVRSVVGSPPLNAPDSRTTDCGLVCGGERLDSAIGDSITEETVGSLSDGIGTMLLSGPVDTDTEDSSQTATEKAAVLEDDRLRREELLNALNFVSEDGDTALQLALIHEQWDFAQYLLDAVTLDPAWTPYLDIQNDLGQTALHLAVIVGRSAFVAALLRAGAGVELQERGGHTPLHLAVRELRMDCVRELTSCPRTPPQHLTITNYAGVSALHLAVQRGRCDIISMLLEAGADINQRDQGSGRSPLHWAVEAQSCAVVELLLRAGAIVDQRTYAGHTPLGCALYRPNKELQTLLRAAGASTAQEDEDEDDDDDGDEEEEEELESEEDEFDDVIINGQRVM
ncbi:NF-kappa-B inhibitor beta [Electrophorus electricus]|uniref:NF-kappa-B inhibitor beta n=1 Tax=Electrophorus electricus TaxID=8005 RepID=UPI0015CFA8EA|nr:NF-kappa-B inhibitor beta [Electrophorus electricus]